MSASPASVRERILDAAIGLLRAHGLKKLAQPQVARAAGVQQGHLTYYFPRRVDLVAAIGERFIQTMGADVQALVSTPEWRASDASVRSRLHALVSHIVRDRERTRMLLALIVESENDPALRESVRANASRVRALLAYVLGRDERDPDVQLALALLWGLGLQQLVLAETRSHAETDALVDQSMRWINTIARGGIEPPLAATKKKPVAKRARSKRTVTSPSARTRRRP